MPTNLALDDELLTQAMDIGNFKTKRETVTVALRELIQRRETLRIVDLFGSVDYDEDYDYKRLRATR